MKRILVLVLLLIVVPVGGAVAAPGTLDNSFANPNVFKVASISATAIQADSKILIGGNFSTVGGQPRNGVARLNADGTLDTSFAAPNVSATYFYASVRKIAIQADGKIVIGGNFTIVGGQPRRGVARLNPDGTLDTSFDPNLGDEYNNVNDIEIQADGKILIGGSFSSPSGQLRVVIRLTADGTLDDSFTSLYFVVGGVSDMAIQSDGKIIIGGGFSAGFVARLNSDGTLDTSFANPNFPAGVVYALAIQADGKIIIGGGFTVIGGQPRNGAARLNPDGTLDASFTNPNVSGNVTGIAIQADSKILISGGFHAVGGPFRRGVARLNADGTLDGSFADPNVSGVSGISNSYFFVFVSEIAIQADGKIVIGGDFISVGDQPRNGAARLNPDGTPDVSFTNPNSFREGSVNNLEIQADGKIVISGDFISVGGQPRNGVARLNADGTLDTSFAAPNISATYFYASVTEIAIQADGKIVIGGDFNSVGGQIRNGVARLNSNGTLDTSFANPNVFGVTDIAIQADSKIVIGGIISVGGQIRRGAARLNADGTLDTSFVDPNVEGGENLFVSDIEIQADGKIVIGGSFYSVGGQTRNHVARLNSNGTLDTSFADPNVIIDFGYVTNIAIQANDKIVISGFFNSVGGQIRRGIARLNSNGTLDTSFVNPNVEGAKYVFVNALAIQADGKIVIGGNFTIVGGQTRRRMARLNSNGMLDTSFTDPDVSGSVDDIAIQVDGKIVIGGSFSAVGGQPRSGIARLNNAGTGTRFDFDGDGRADVSVFRPSTGTWYLQQSQAGFAGIAFGQAGDKITPADFDGDGKTDIAVYRGGTWYLQRSSAGFTGVSFGAATDIPVPADFDGDGRAELAVYRNGFWFTFNLANNQFSTVQFGLPTDKAVPADYDGDGKADIAVYRDGIWYLLRSRDGFAAIQFGNASDKPVAADYDGDGKANVAVFRAGVWYLLRSAAGFTAVEFGSATDTPAPADYDGDGKTDIAVFRGGVWYLLRSQQGFGAVEFGAASDQPIPAAFVPQN